MTRQKAIEIEQNYSKIITVKSVVKNFFTDLREKYTPVYQALNPADVDVLEYFADVDGNEIETATNRAALGRITDIRSKMQALNLAIAAIEAEDFYSAETKALITAEKALIEAAK